MRVSPQTIAALLLNGASAAALAVLPPPACTPDPERANRFTIDGLAYHTGEPVPRIHLKNGDWAYLSGDKALNTVRKRAINHMACARRPAVRQAAGGLSRHGSSAS